MNRLPLPDSWRRRAIVVSELEIPLDWFTTEELEQAESFARRKRRAEWLLSRAAAKELAVHLGRVATHADCRVSDLSNLSLSHSSPYAAAAMDVAPVGIDVQVVRPLDPRIAHFYLTEAETEAALRSPVADPLIHFWSAKEAAWKQLGGRVETLKRVPLLLLEASEDGLVFDRVETRRIGEVVVALTRPTS